MTKFMNLAQVIERHREKLNKKNAEITNLNRKTENLKKELDYSKINMNEYKVFLVISFCLIIIYQKQQMYNNVIEKYQKLEENLNFMEGKNEGLRENLSKYENQINHFNEIREKYEVI